MESDNVKNEKKRKGMRPSKPNLKWGLERERRTVTDNG